MEKEHIYTIVTIIIGAIIRHFEKKHDKKKEEKVYTEFMELKASDIVTYENAEDEF